jgi:hypothetical protein
MINLGSIAVVERPKNRVAKREQKTEQTCLSTAELTECTCPEPCERDHDTD